MGGIISAGVALGIVAAGGVAVGVIAVGDPGIGAWVPYGWHHGNAVSYYTAQKVPHILRSLEPLLNTAVSINQYFIIIMPLSMLALLALSYLQYRERERIRTDDDWLID